MPTIDYDFGPNWEFNLGVGMGVTRSTDHLLVKMIIGRALPVHHAAPSPHLKRGCGRRGGMIAAVIEFRERQRGSVTVSSSPPPSPESVQPKSADFPVPLGLPPIPWPEDNPYSPPRAELGKLLFFDGRLSANGVVSCAFCHEPSARLRG